MISLPDREAMLAALATALPADLHTIITDIVEHAAETGLLDLTYIVIVEPGDTEGALAEELGHSPLINPSDGIRCDQPGFIPYWSHLRQRGRWYELVHTISNDAFAFILLIDSEGGGELVALCERQL
jgi:hypothetical protein